ncbi:hypothetical protein FA95DRAFT_597039 [Auriscalpium vulgare]|uniref:Uncharacterized protein n=1 Tax=Auriscalpium vulgare TaxID=40419 RepID=A0ACB8S2W9_9AGAM|nr:hypothetical protein FA95DRAFT_597039 [Auriscalpium vulgare]
MRAMGRRPRNGTLLSGPLSPTLSLCDARCASAMSIVDEASALLRNTSAIGKFMRTTRVGVLLPRPSGWLARGPHTLHSQRREPASPTTVLHERTKHGRAAPRAKQRYKQTLYCVGIMYTIIRPCLTDETGLSRDALPVRGPWAGGPLLGWCAPIRGAGRSSHSHGHHTPANLAESKTRIYAGNPHGPLSHRRVDTHRQWKGYGGGVGLIGTDRSCRE